MVVSSTILRLPLDSALCMTCYLVMSDPQEGTGSNEDQVGLGRLQVSGSQNGGELESGTQARTLYGWCCEPATPV